MDAVEKLVAVQPKSHQLLQQIILKQNIPQRYITCTMTFGFLKQVKNVLQKENRTIQIANTQSM